MRSIDTKKVRIDLHIHTNVSDGTDSPGELLERIRNSGFSVFSVTDHDAVKAGNIIRPLLKEGDPVFIQGAEFSCRDENGKYHILGYGFDPESPSVLELIEYGHSLRMRKLSGRLDGLKTVFGFSFSKEDTDALFGLDNPGKPHIANLMVRYGYSDSIPNAINNYLNHIHLAGQYLRPEKAISGILAGGGVPVLAHPFYGSGDELIIGADIEDRLRRLSDCGLKGIEAYYSGFSDKQRAEGILLADAYGLFVTAGSDYHGTNKLVTLGDTGLDSEAVYPEGLLRFLEHFGCTV